MGNVYTEAILDRKKTQRSTLKLSCAAGTQSRQQCVLVQELNAETDALLI